MLKFTELIVESKAELAGPKLASLSRTSFSAALSKAYFTLAPANVIYDTLTSSDILLEGTQDYLNFL